jgi:hypothetical protein
VKEALVAQRYLGITIRVLAWLKIERVLESFLEMSGFFEGLREDFRVLGC